MSSFIFEIYVVKFLFDNGNCLSCHPFLAMQDILRETEDHDLGSAISHFLNCFFGSCQAVGAKLTSSIQAKSQKKVCLI